MMSCELLVHNFPKIQDICELKVQKELLVISKYLLSKKINNQKWN